MNTAVKYIKSFSKGQITIPKDIRDSIGIGEDFWLKVSVVDGKIVAEPVSETSKPEDYVKKLLKIKGKWFSGKEHKKVREEVEERTTRLDK